MMACLRCGGPKPPGRGRRLCDPCAAAVRKTGGPMQPCWRCGGKKAPGWHGVYCPACTEIAAEARRQRRSPAPLPRRSPSEPLRLALMHSGMTKADVARSLGWMRGGKPDTTRVARTLGRPAVNSRTAVLMAPVLGLDPVDLGQ